MVTRPLARLEPGGAVAGRALDCVRATLQAGKAVVIRPEVVADKMDSDAESEEGVDKARKRSESRPHSAMQGKLMEDA